MRARYLFYLLIFNVAIAFGQVRNDLQYYKVVDTNGRRIINSLAMSLEAETGFFSDRKGIISILSKSIAENKVFIFSAPNHNPKIIESKLVFKDTTFVVLDAYRSFVKTEKARIKGFGKMKQVFLNEHLRNGKFESKVLQKRIMTLNEVPIEIAGVSGRLIPSKTDTGMVLSSLRLSDLDYTSTNNYQEEIISRIDSGLFKEIGGFSLLEMIRDIESETFNVSPLSNFEYPSPIAQKNSLKYHYYLVDSVVYKSFKLYRVHFIQGKEFSPLFQGDIWVDSDTEQLLEMHLKLRKQNHINYADSVQIHFYIYRNHLKKEGNAQHIEVWVNLLNYKLKLDVNTLLLGGIVENDTTRIDEKYRVVEYVQKNTKDSLLNVLPYINGNTDILEGLNKQYSIGSKDYKISNIFEDKIGFARSFFLTGANYYFGHGYVELVPFILANGFNTVEGWYFNYRATYHYKGKDDNVIFTPYLRYGFASKQISPRFELEYNFKPRDPIKIMLEGGVKMQQFNELEPIDPFINTLYSLGLSKNYLSIYQKKYIKFTFDKELIRGMELVFSFETGQRAALFNNSTVTLFGDGSGYFKNNPERPPEITADEGFKEHNINTVKIQLYYQFGRRYDFIKNKLIKLESPLPRVSLIYRAGLGYKEGTPNYNFVRVSAGNKTRIRNVGLFEFDVVLGSFYSVEHIEFPDFKHFNGVQTAFINNTYDGWTDVRQFSTLPYYDFSTRERFVEVHLKHRFLGWLLSKPKHSKRLLLQSYTGANYLYTSDVGQYGEVYFGIENIMRVLNVQAALGIGQGGFLRFSFLVGVNFDYTFYLNARTQR